ncbi:MAG: WYL domain-containing protein [Abditibacteriales bacterium]|nr:WYL domain-containing protein [Abditibacteriales bacterium]MDW8367596.1 WYL domain-containing protein [Abditibacteriales bacterium]
MPRRAHLTRLAKLLSRLSHRRPYTAKQLAAAFEVSERTIRRDINLWREAGVPINADDKGYHLDRNAGFFLPPLNLLTEEVAALKVAGHATLLNRGAPWAQPLQAALDKIDAALSDQQSDRSRRLANAVLLHPAQTDRLPSPLIRQLEEAIADRATVQILYKALEADRAEWRTVDPHKIAFLRHAYYLVAKSHGTRRFINYRLTRIHKVERTGATFRRDREGLRKHLSSGSPFGGEPIRLKLRLTGRVALLAQENRYFPHQRTARQPDGSVLLTACVNPHDARLQTLAWGDEAEVIEPADLRHEVAAIAWRMMERYR